VEHPLLALHGIVKEYEGAPRPLRVLDGVDLDLKAGEAVAVIGPSGSGKSTLLNIAGTLDEPSSGTVVLDGRDITRVSETERARIRSRAIGFVFQFHHLLPQCSVIENVLLPTLANKDAAQPLERAAHLLERVGLSERSHHLPGRLSGGERQRAAVVRALINRPRLLLADEPTGSLNREAADELTELLIELNREEGMALVVVTHSAAVADRMDRVLELREGVLAPSPARHG
jgi:lipoprotein-releasing system ATP-binding protein